MNKTLILSHTEFSRQFHKGGIGEIANSAKLALLMQQMGYRVDPIVDIYDLCGEPTNKLYRDLAQINLDLAELGHPLLENCELPEAKMIFQKVELHSPQTIFILSWHWTLAGLFATGIQRICPTVGKFYVYHKNQRVLSELYAPMDFLITESLLANLKGVEYGIAPWKMIYLPHHFPQSIERFKPDRKHLEKVAWNRKKTLKISENTLIVGMVSRLSIRKNCSYLFDAVAKLVEEGHDILLVVKGDFDGKQPLLKEKMAPYLQEPWFLWDPTYTPFPQVVSLYRTFDLFVNLSGREGASNTVVEMLSLGIPTVVLDGTTNPYLFKGGALFVKNDGTVHHEGYPFQAPDEEALLETLRSLIESPTLRKEWQRRAKTVACQRFHPDVTLKRLPLIFERLSSRGEDKACRAKVENLYQTDLALYGFE